MTGRSWSQNDQYRFGFNGKETDPETDLQDYGFRIYNPAVARFLSVDPLAPDFPWYTPYQFAGNKPISFIDLDGLEDYYTADGRLIEGLNGPRPFLELKNAGAVFYGTGEYTSEYHDANDVGEFILSEIKSLKIHPWDYEIPFSVKGTIKNSMKYYHPGGECYACTIGRLNHGYEELKNLTPINIQFDRKGNVIKNEDFRLSSSQNLREFNREILGYGPGSALFRNGYGSLVSPDRIWSGDLKPGASIQWFYGNNEEEIKEKLITGDPDLSGHSAIFKEYEYDDDGNIISFLYYDWYGDSKLRKVKAEAEGYIVFGVNLGITTQRELTKRIIYPVDNSVLPERSTINVDHLKLENTF